MMRFRERSMKKTGRRLALCLALGAAAAGAAGIARPEVRPPKADPRRPDLRLPAGVRPLEYAVDLKITPESDAFSGAVDIDIDLSKPTSLVWLNGTELTISRAVLEVAGRSRTARVVPGGDDFVGMAFDAPVGPGRARLHAEFEGKVSATSTTGIFRQKVGSDWYTFTQFESIDARRAFPCFDEPSDKVPWRLTLRVPQNDVAVANTPVLSEQRQVDGWKTVRFAPTRPLPSYLVAFGVGPFDVVDAGRAGRNHTPIRMIVPKGRKEEARYAAASTGPLLDLLEDYFGIPYPYAKLDNLVIPQTVRFGAMENAGLVTYNEGILLERPDRETPSFRLRYASICAHETAHQWFGDLVTLAWWNDTWLNESFATWMADKVLEKWKPEWNIPEERVASRADTMGNDLLVSARKIRQPIVTKGDIDNAFDDISYGKGSAVLSMFESWTGREKFQKGVRRYLTAHADGNATAEDFLAALEAEGGSGLGKAFATFLDQAGVPLVTVRLACDAGKPPALELSQKRLLPQGSSDAAAPVWSIPVCARFGGAGWSSQLCDLFTEKTARLPLAAARSCPSWVLANDGERGYYGSLYDGPMLKALMSAKASLTAPEQVGVLREIATLARSGLLPWAEALAVVPSFSADSDPKIVGADLRIVEGLDTEDLVPEDHRSDYERFVRKTFGGRAREFGWKSRAGENEEIGLLRPRLVGFVARVGRDADLRGEARALALAWLENVHTLDPDTASAVLSIAAQDGDRALFDRYRARIPTLPDRADRRRLLGALGRFGDPALEKEALALLLSDAVDVREAAAVLFSAVSHRDTLPVAWEFFKSNFDALRTRLPREMLGIFPFVGASFCDAAHRADVEAFFRPRLAALTGAERTLAETLELVDQCVHARAEQSASVGAFFAGS